MAGMRDNKHASLDPRLNDPFAIPLDEAQCVVSLRYSNAPHYEVVGRLSCGREYLLVSHLLVYEGSVDERILNCQAIIETEDGGLLRLPMYLPHHPYMKLGEPPKTNVSFPLTD